MVLRYQRARSWHSWESIISVDDSSAVQPFQAPLFPWRNSYMSTNRDRETNEINALLWSTKKWQQTEKSQQIEKTAPKLWQQASKPGDIALYGCCLAALRDKYWLFSIVTAAADCALVRRESPASIRNLRWRPLFSARPTAAQLTSQLDECLITLGNSQEPLVPCFAGRQPWLISFCHWHKHVQTKKVWYKNNWHPFLCLLDCQQEMKQREMHVMPRAMCWMMTYLFSPNKVTKLTDLWISALQLSHVNNPTMHKSHKKHE